jgi:hypothetical protein
MSNLFGKNQWELSSANSSVSFPFSFCTHPALTSKFAYHSLNTRLSVSPYIGCSFIPFSLYLLGHATSQISNTIPLVYARTNDPMNEHRLVMKVSYDTIFSPFRIVKSPQSNMFFSLFFVTKSSASSNVDIILVMSD